MNEMRIEKRTQFTRWDKAKLVLGSVIVELRLRFEYSSRIGIEARRGVARQTEGTPRSLVRSGRGEARRGEARSERYTY